MKTKLVFVFFILNLWACSAYQCGSLSVSSGAPPLGLSTFPCKLTENAKQNIDSNVASITALLGQDWVADINPSYLTIPNTQFDVVWYIPVPEDQLLSIASTAKSFQSADLSEDQIKSETVRRCVLDQEKTVENLKSLLRNPLIETCVQMEWRDAGIEFRKKKKRVMPTETKVHEV